MDCFQAVAFGAFALSTACGSMASDAGNLGGAGGARASAGSAITSSASGAGGSAPFVCLPAPTCGGDYVATWKLSEGCAIVAVPLAGCGTITILFDAATGAITLTATDTYTANITLGASSSVAIPVTCGGVKVCSELDSALLACTGEPAKGCTCTGVPVTESGTFAASGGALVLSSNGPQALKAIEGWCVHGDAIDFSTAGTLVLRGLRE